MLARATKTCGHNLLAFPTTAFCASQFKRTFYTFSWSHLQTTSDTKPSANDNKTLPISCIWETSSDNADLRIKQGTLLALKSTPSVLERNKQTLSWKAVWNHYHMTGKTGMSLNPHLNHAVPNPEPTTRSLSFWRCKWWCCGVLGFRFRGSFGWLVLGFLYRR